MKRNSRIHFSEASTPYEEKSLHQLLSSCPVLEDLVVERDECYCFGTLSVTVLSFQRLTIKIYSQDWFDRLEINTPSLKFLKVTDYGDENDNDNNSYSFYYEDMPKLEEVEIGSTYLDIDKFVRSITYVKRLSFCIRVKDEEDNIGSCVDPPDYILVCISSSLETLTLLNGSKKEIDLVKYILRNARCLKAAKILFQSSCSPEEKDELKSVIRDLSLSVRASE